MLIMLVKMRARVLLQIRNPRDAVLLVQKNRDVTRAMWTRRMNKRRERKSSELLDIVGGGTRRFI